jgi:starch synthase
MEGLLHLDLQFVLLGAGDPDAEAYLRRLDSQRGDRFRAWLHFDNRRAHRIEAGCDFFVMPSRYEPCGLNQLYSLRYGTLPIVRATGGLADTVINYDEHTGRGTGFVFHDLNPGAVYNTVGWALAIWYNRPGHIAEMRRQAMEQDFSWEHSATEYEQLYLRAYERRRGHPFAGR